MTLRGVRSSDRPALARILAACGAFNAEEVRVALDMIDCGLDGEYALLAAETAGALEGYACYGPASLTQASWYLYWIAVRREGQGRGIGRALLDAVEHDIRSRQGARLVIETSGRADYALARDFYRRQGYLEVGRIADFYRPGDDCVIFSKAIAAGRRPERG